ncbi:MAG: preprotein translocase subunit YajC [Burkholderiales bacterium]|jgi:preprotein translocase subunit YajC|nr:preprotein translocase subunit YajC [Burkholderiales bacterium]
MQFLQFAPLVLMFVVLYFLMIRPQMKKQKEHRNMIAAVAKGDEIVTSGGVMGRITGVAEHHVSVEIASGVEIQLQKPAISAVLPKGTLRKAT